MKVNDMSRIHKIVLNYCLSSEIKNPIDLFNEIVDFDIIPIHGPIHHFIMPAVMLTCYNNVKGNPIEIKNIHLEEAFQRSIIIPGAFCANFGACGAALGMGIFYSILSKNSPLSEKSWADTINLTSMCLLSISKLGGPRCCKRNGYLSILEACRQSKELLGVTFEINNDIFCVFSKMNLQCLKKNCPFFKNDILL